MKRTFLILMLLPFSLCHKASEDKIFILPCELIENNGETSKKVLIQYYNLWKLPVAFMTWFNNSLIFYNTLVDRIVPGFPSTEIEKIQNKLGYTDNLVVKAEPYLLWVLEGSEEIKEHLPFEASKLNIKLTNTLYSYRQRKVRILNGLHTVMVPYAYAKGFKTVGEVMNGENCKAFIENIVFNEIIPSLDGNTEELILIMPQLYLNGLKTLLLSINWKPLHLTQFLSLVSVYCLL